MTPNSINSTGNPHANVPNYSSNMEMYRKINTFIQQISDGVPLSDCIAELRNTSDTNGYGVNFLQRLQDFVSFTLSDLQIHGAIIAYVIHNGEIPNVNLLGEFLRDNKIYSIVPNNAEEEIINSFRGHYSNNATFTHNFLVDAKQEYYRNTFNQLNSANQMNQIDVFNLLDRLIERFLPFSNYNMHVQNPNVEFINNMYSTLLSLNDPTHQSLLATKLVTKIYMYYQSNSWGEYHIEFSIMYGEHFSLLMNNFMSNENIVRLICDLYTQTRLVSYFDRSSRNNTPIRILENLRSTERISDIVSRLLVLEELSVHQRFYLILPLKNVGEHNVEIRQILQIAITQIAGEALTDVFIFHSAPEFLPALLNEEELLPTSVYNELSVFRRESQSHLSRRPSMLERSFGSRDIIGNNFNENIVNKLPYECRESFSSLLTKLSKDEKKILISTIRKIISNHLTNVLRESFIHIIKAMDNNIRIRQACLQTASGYSDTCGDGARVAFILMLLDVKTYSDRLTIEHALVVARTRRKITDVFNYVREKMGHKGDHVEVALKLLLDLQARGYINNIGVDDMLHGDMAGDKQFEAYKINIEEVIERIIKSNPVKEYEILQSMFPDLETLYGVEHALIFAQIRKECNNQLEDLDLSNIDQLDESSKIESQIRSNEISNKLYTELLSYVYAHAREMDMNLERK